MNAQLPLLTWSRAEDGPALSGRLGNMTSRGPFQPALLQSVGP